MKSHVLIVESEPTLAYALCEFFSAIGGRVDWSRDRKEAERMLDDKTFSAVVVNLRLPDEPQGGLTVAWRARRASPGARIVLITLPHESPALEKQARACGVDILMNKPKPLSALVAKALKTGT